MAKSDNVGVELIRQGWHQGSLVRAIPVTISWFALDTENTGGLEKWIRRETPLKEDDYLIVISQICDIQKRPEQEPFVEMIRAYWTCPVPAKRDATIREHKELCAPYRRVNKIYISSSELQSQLNNIITQNTCIPPKVTFGVV